MNNQENNSQKVNLHIYGGNRTLVDFDAVKAVHTPDVSYRSKPNKDKRACGISSTHRSRLPCHPNHERFEANGFTIQDEVHSLARDNNHYFGLFAVDHPNRAESIVVA